MTAPNWSLPADSASQTYVSVSAIPVGSLYLADKEVFEDMIHQESQQLKGTGRRVPSFSFLIQHEKHGRALFDLGMRKHGQGYPPEIQKDLHPFWTKCKTDIVDLLDAGKLKPSDISTVIYSHLHFDHIGDLTPFSSALLVAGSGAAPAFASPYPQNPEGQVHPLPAGQKVRYIDFALGKPLGPFSKAIDYFGDGSFYLIDAPGHSAGHLCALARTGPNQFVLLAADCCHHRLCYNPGERLVSSENHEDIAVARHTVELLKSAHKAKNLVVLLAHDDILIPELGEENLFPAGTLNGWAGRAIEKKKLI
ncbi:hypothetical protein HWV62_40906 [Athelia sp. TMB]|nr:hypothetical protein HWV62_40906 [Athelia sp. TMB]